MPKQLQLEDNSLETLPGVGKVTKTKLQNIGINRITDLLLHLPNYLIDKTNISKITDIKNGDKCLFIGIINNIFYTRGFHKNLILSVSVQSIDIQIRFIHKIIVYKHLKIGDKVRIYGVIYINSSKKIMIHPEIEVIQNEHNLEMIVPYYNTRRQISQSKIRKLIRFVLDYLRKKNSQDIFDKNILESFNIPNHLDALENCHFPSAKSFDDAVNEFEKSRRRFVLEEIISKNIRLDEMKQNMQRKQSHKFSYDKNDIDEFINSLPFELTDSQAQAVNLICSNLAGEYASSRLIQGDVGCGKTIVSTIIAYATYLSGLQAAFLAPTELLVDQHYNYIKDSFSDKDIQVAYLKGSMSTKAKHSVLKSLKNGSIDIVIGTHSLINSSISFKKLGLCVIDEQHKFGINQRSSFIQKRDSSNMSPHIIYMSATPIPRSLALVLYQGLDYTTINDVPKGRKHIITERIDLDNRSIMYSKIKNRLSEGEKVFWVCPAINTGESSELESVYSVQDELLNIFKGRNIAVLHGQLDDNIEADTIKKFRDDKIDILICTTVIEVGVNIPNATCIVIEDSNRFGLSQLHQLRGRVGRSTRQGFCFLAYKSHLSENAEMRLNSLASHSSGFKIAEEDLLIRGSGDYFGNRQSGHINNFKLATLQDFLTNVDIIKNLQVKISNLPDITRSQLLKRWRNEEEDSFKL